MKSGYELTRAAQVQRWKMIRQCIDAGVFDDEEHFRAWLSATFGKRSTRALSAGQLRVLHIHLRYYIDPSKPVDFEVAYPWRINAKQRWRIEELQRMLGWSDERLNDFLSHQLGCRTFLRALSREAATKVLVGMEKINKSKQGGTRNG